MAPRLSVIIPCYLDAATLERALASLRAQTRPADEVIVVDDCSPQADRIREVLSGFPGTVYVRNAENLGLAGARNRGLKEAKSDIVAFLDADDEAHPQRLEWQLQHIAPGVAVTCDTARIEPGEPAPKPLYSPPARVSTYRGVGSMIYANRLTGASLMAPAELLRAVGGYDAALRSCEDYDLWLRLLARGVVVRRIRQPLYLYHQNPDGLSRRLRDISHWELAVVEKFVAAGVAGAPDGLRAGTVWAVWLLRHFARAARHSDSELRRQATAQLARLEPWPMLRWLVGAVAATILR